MRVIGTTASGFILTASDSEVAKLLGYAYESAARNRGAIIRPKVVSVGDEFNVAGMFSSLDKIADLKGKVEQVRGVLQTVAGALEVAEPLICQISDPVVEARKNE